ncbi:MAG: hypothetical protein OCD00_18770 [Colwellia sp.]
MYLYKKIKLIFNKYIKKIYCLSLFFIVQTYACEQLPGNDIPVLVFPKTLDSQQPEKGYYFQLIQLILKKSSLKFGPCEARLLDHKYPLKRLVYYLRKNHLIDAAAFTVTQERNKNLLPIRIPISKGLIGYRLLMIHKEDIEKFSKINNLAELRNYTAGQGVGWADVKILESNNLPVVTTGSTKTLITMLGYKRFNYFPRGALQITTEIEANQDKPVTIEPSLVITYPSMIAFYVNSTNTKLAQRLEHGLKLAFADGSFHDFFNNHPSSIKALSNLNLKQRKNFKICNPILPAWVPLDKAEYWLEPWSEKIVNNECNRQN